MVAKGGALGDLDLSLKLTPRQEEVRLTAAQDRLLQLRLILGGLIGDKPQLGPPVCVVFEGWDASGPSGVRSRPAQVESSTDLPGFEFLVNSKEGLSCRARTCAVPARASTASTTLV